ncbi:hypothetical protein NL298_27655, partial [Klebsiella pneumoniae]|nr:hypothetical protein [Klebsiella pneumoniae]
NCVGVIDSGYRGEITLKFKHTHPDVWIDWVHESLGTKQVKAYAIGDRIGQIIIIPYPNIEFEESEELSDTERGSGGY